MHAPCGSRRGRNRGWRRAALGAVGLALPFVVAGCMKVPPRPIDVPASANAAAHAGLDSGAVTTRAGTLAPGAAVDSVRPDRLWLFAALLQHDPRVLEARRAIASAQREAVSSRHSASPTLTLTSEYANDPATSSPWLLGGAVDVPLDIGGRRASRLQRADLAILQARYDYAETIWADRTALHNALIDYFAARAQLPLYRNLLALQDRRLEALERRAAQGEDARLLVYPARADRAAVARRLEETQAREGKARTAIAGVLGVPEAALQPLGLVWDDFAEPTATLPAIGAKERAAAGAARADVLKAVAGYDGAEADLHLELARQYPAISLGPGYTWERGLVKLPLAVNLSLPPLDFNRSAIRAALAKRDQAGAAIETRITAALNEIEAALAERNAAWDSLARIRAGELPQSEKQAASADDRLRLGGISRAEWADAKIAALEARLAALDATVRVRQAETALEDALRRPLDGPETMIDPRRIGEDL